MCRAWPRRLPTLGLLVLKVVLFAAHGRTLGMQPYTSLSFDFVASSSVPRIAAEVERIEREPLATALGGVEAIGRETGGLRGGLRGG